MGKGPAPKLSKASPNAAALAALKLRERAVAGGLEALVSG
jgi:hypothetical protein